VQPTATPTSVPTVEITREPTNAPTPTAAPTPVPTPTAAPVSPEPSAEPTVAPTVEPTPVPTAQPTVEPSEEPVPTAALVVEENEEGFCGIDGAVESNNQGFTGIGFANSDNAIDAGIDWSVDVEASGNYEIRWRFAHGGDGVRSANILVNNNVQANMDFESTANWTTWQNSAAITVYLDAGKNTLRLVADTAQGLPNIDNLQVLSTGVSPGECSSVSPTDVPTPTSTPAPSVPPSATPTPDPSPSVTPTAAPSSSPSPAPTSTPAPTNPPVAGDFPEQSELKAFPSAEGYGRFAKGGRGGRVIHVTNLNDSGPGSLRAAIDETGPRTIVFDVSGVIELKSKLLITGTKGNGFVTLAGHTAPGKGVVIKGWTFGMIGGSDVVVRFIRTRIGTSSGETMDGMGMASAENSIFDHCSISWTIDEAFSSRSANDITLQRTLISEALNQAGHRKYGDNAQHGYCASIGGDTGSFHHNLLAHCAGRNWSLAGGLGKSPFVYVGKIDIRNNVVYNWRHRTTDGGAHEVNFVNNYYKPGPSTEVLFALNAQNDGFPGTQRYYFEGNIMEGHWDESNQDKGKKATGEPRDYDPWVSEPFFESYVTTQSASDAYENVLADVGANVPVLDDHDKRVIEEVRNGTFTYRGSKTGYPGLPDNEADVGGFEDYPVIYRDENWDSDRDGMPNEWELAHGLNPNDPSDGNATTFSNVGYTNLEMYLAELAGDFD